MSDRISSDEVRKLITDMVKPGIEHDQLAKEFLETLNVGVVKPYSPRKFWNQLKGTRLINNLSDSQKEKIEAKIKEYEGSKPAWRKAAKGAGKKARSALSWLRPPKPVRKRMGVLADKFFGAMGANELLDAMARYDPKTGALLSTTQRVDTSDPRYQLKQKKSIQSHVRNKQIKIMILSSDKQFSPQLRKLWGSMDTLAEKRGVTLTQRDKDRIVMGGKFDEPAATRTSADSSESTQLGIARQMIEGLEQEYDPPPLDLVGVDESAPLENLQKMHDAQLNHLTNKGKKERQALLDRASRADAIGTERIRFALALLALRRGQERKSMLKSHHKRELQFLSNELDGKKDLPEYLAHLSRTTDKENKAEYAIRRRQLRVFMNHTGRRRTNAAKYLMDKLTIMQLKERKQDLEEMRSEHPLTKEYVDIELAAVDEELKKAVESFNEVKDSDELTDQIKSDQFLIDAIQAGGKLL